MPEHVPLPVSEPDIARTQVCELTISLVRTRRIAGFTLVTLTSLWAMMALAVDWHVIGAIAYGTVVGAALYWFRGRPARQLLAGLICFAAVLVWWLSLKPPKNGDWPPDQSITAWAEIHGSQVTIHNLRLCDYRTELDFTCQWLTRTVDLNQIDGADLFMNYWGSPLIAHTIVSFQIQKEPPIAFSIETRRHKGETYSALLGFFRRYTLISVVSDERDVVRLRTNYRHNENLYLYHTTATREFARSLFMNYIGLTNELNDRPEWYNAVTHNCTTQIYTLKSMKSQPLDWRIFLNGKADEMAYQRGMIATGGLPFNRLKQRAWINPAARAADTDPDFSARIRQNRPGF